MKEEWEIIEGTNCLMEVSNFGEVRSWKTQTSSWEYPETLDRPRLVSEQIKPDGTSVVLIRGKYYYVHRLVAEAFVPKPKGASQVIFKDGDKTNYLANNLQWGKRGGKQMKTVKCVETGEVFPSVSSATTKYKCNKQNLLDVLNHKKGHSTVKGYHFEYVK